MAPLRNSPAFVEKLDRVAQLVDNVANLVEKQYKNMDENRYKYGWKQILKLIQILCFIQGPVPVGMGGNYSPSGSQRRRDLFKLSLTSSSSPFITITIIVIAIIAIIIVTEKFEDETHVTPVVEPAGHFCAEAEWEARINIWLENDTDQHGSTYGWRMMKIWDEHLIFSFLSGRMRKFSHRAEI